MLCLFWCCTFLDATGLQVLDSELGWESFRKDYGAHTWQWLNVCKNAVVLPLRTWNCVVRNTKLLLATNPCDEMVEIHNPSCTIDGSKRGFICSLSSVQLAIQWAMYALIQQYCRVKSEIVLWEMQNDSWPQIHVVNWQKSNGQTGGAWVDKLGAHLDLL